MSERREFVALASQDGANLAALCRRFEISRKTGYKWLQRYQSEGDDGLADQSRRPQASPARTPIAVEQAVLAVRDEHPAWGGRKIRRVLQQAGYGDVPAASTITEILRRHGRLDRQGGRVQKAYKRFEHPYPNDLWQMDFKGHFPTGRERCHALTVLDDHSRYCLGLRACRHERGETVQAELTAIFRRYGLPRRMLMDNGAPWFGLAEHPWTPLTVWLLRLDVRVSHGRPYHPQTQGKDERFHRTLGVELLQGRRFDDLDHCQRDFDHWRQVYNHVRPHEALALEPPETRYRPSTWSFPEQLPPVEYDSSDHVRKVQNRGRVSFRGLQVRVGKPFIGQHVALRPTRQDGRFDIYYCRQPVAWADLRRRESGPYRSSPPQPMGEPAPQVPPNPLLGLLPLRPETPDGCQASR
jgi:transposase InsO family protein